MGQQNPSVDFPKGVKAIPMGLEELEVEYSSPLDTSHTDEPTFPHLNPA